MDGNRIQPFARLQPCVDESGHKFTVSHPPAGQFGYSMVVCTRCGKTREEAMK